MGPTEKPSKLNAKMVKCDQCDKEYTSKSSLGNHKRVKHNKSSPVAMELMGISGNNSKEEEVFEDDDDANELGINEAADDMEVVDVVEDAEKRGLTMAESKPDDGSTMVAHMVVGWYQDQEGLFQQQACGECVTKNEVIEHKEKSLDVKDKIIEKKSQEIKKLQKRITELAKEKAILKKRETKKEKLNKIIGEKQKKIAILTKEVQTKDDIIKAQGGLDDVAVIEINDEQNKPSEVSEEQQAQNITNNDHDKNYECDDCEENFKDEADHINHINSKHAVDTDGEGVITGSESTGDAVPVASEHNAQDRDTGKGTFPCPKCGKACKKQKGLIDHMKRVHVEGVYKHKCDNCKEKFKDQTKLVDHIVSKHVEGDEVEKEEENAEEEEEVITVDEIQKCSQCNATFKSSIAMANHTMLHLANNWECAICWNLFQTEESLMKHLCEVHFNDPNKDDWETLRRARNAQWWTCNFCQAVFKTNATRQSHVCRNHPYQSVKDQELQLNRRNIKCKRGNYCEFNSKGKCWFSHEVTSTEMRQQQPQQQQQQPQMWCKYQENCNKSNNCRFKHFDQGFQPVQNHRQN